MRKETKIYVTILYVVLILLILVNIYFFIKNIKLYNEITSQKSVISVIDELKMS